MPRILRKAATVLRDGVSSGMRAAQSKNFVACADARDLSYLASASVALTITTPPLPMMADPFERMWLRHWFAGLSYRPSSGFEVDSVESWKEFMNASLLEMARVTKPGGRAVIDLHALQLPKETIYLDEVITDDVRATLGRYWDVESLILNTPKASLVKNRDREVRKEALTNRVVVLRRR